MNFADVVVEDEASALIDNVVMTEAGGSGGGS